MGQDRTLGLQRPAVVVLAILTATFAAVLLIPLSLTDPPSSVARMGLTVTVGLVAIVSGVVLWVAVRPEPAGEEWRWPVVALTVLALALWAPMSVWAEPGQEPWAWLAGTVVAAFTLVMLPLGLVAAGIFALVTTAGAVLFDGSVTRALLTLAGMTLAMLLTCQVMVWLVRLLATTDAERTARAELAVAEERLRVSRELHDVLGHRLGIITLKAELAADLAARDPARAAAEAEEIRGLAAETLVEARRSLHGEEPADLASQLAAAELVLTSAGIATMVDVDPDALARLPDGQSCVLASVVREAVTNLLRHSDAREVVVSLADGPGREGRGPGASLRIVNDGVRRPGGPDVGSGTGLASLSARCSAAGTRLVAGPVEGGRFEVGVFVDAPEDTRSDPAQDGE